MTIKRFTIIIFLCFLAALFNNSLIFLSYHVDEFPLYLDTVFTSAIVFTLGLLPGLITVIFTWLIGIIQEGNVHPYIISNITEVFLIWSLSPLFIIKKIIKKQGTPVSTFAGLLLLYITCCITMSVLSGIIDHVYYNILARSRPFFNPEDFFKLYLMHSNAPELLTNILSRIPVNIVDRFIVIFGGYFISRGLKKFI